MIVVITAAVVIGQDRRILADDRSLGNIHDVGHAQLVQLVRAQRSRPAMERLRIEIRLSSFCCWRDDNQIPLTRLRVRVPG